MISLETSIDIEAPAEVVWRVLTDFASYAEWNPFMRQARGEARPGARLEVRVEQADGRGTTARPTILVAQAPRELRWRSKLPIPGLFTGDHYFVIEPAGAGRTRLIQGEDFSGLLARLISRDVQQRAVAGYEAMNAALKQRAEAGG